MKGRRHFLHISHHSCRLDESQLCPTFCEFNRNQTLRLQLKSGLTSCTAKSLLAAGCLLWTVLSRANQDKHRHAALYPMTASSPNLRMLHCAPISEIAPELLLDKLKRASRETKLRDLRIRSACAFPLQLSFLVQFFPLRRVEIGFSIWPPKARSRALERHPVAAFQLEDFSRFVGCGDL